MVRWVTSNAQLADCLTKSMDSSVLRSCLKSGRYSLFDEQCILKQRSDKRQRLKWAKEVAKSEPAFVQTDAILDTWDVSDPGKVVRIHNRPRTRLFSPIGVQDCPVDLRNLSLERVTIGCDVTGRTWQDSDFWPGTRGHFSRDTPWTGMTIFKVKGM